MSRRSSRRLPSPRGTGGVPSRPATPRGARGNKSVSLTDNDTVRPASREETLPVAMGALALCCLTLIICLQKGYLLLYGDAVAHLGIARRILDARYPGIAQLGGVWLPLPHLLMLPFIGNMEWWQNGMAGAWPSLAAFLLAVIAFYRLARRLIPPLWALAATAFFALNPNLLYMATTALTEPLFLAIILWLVLLTTECLDSLNAASLNQTASTSAAHTQAAANTPASHTQASNKPAARTQAADTQVDRTPAAARAPLGRPSDRHLARVRSRLFWLGVLIVAAVYTRYDGWILAALIWCVLAIALLRHRQHLPQLRAAFALFTVVTVAAPLGWFAYNQHFYGDFLDFLRGPYSASAIERKTSPPGAKHYRGWHNPAWALLFYTRTAQVDSTAWEIGFLTLPLALIGAWRVFLDWLHPHDQSTSYAPQQGRHLDRSATRAAERSLPSKDPEPIPAPSPKTLSPTGSPNPAITPQEGRSATRAVETPPHSAPTQAQASYAPQQGRHLDRSATRAAERSLPSKDPEPIPAPSSQPLNPAALLLWFPLPFYVYSIAYGSVPIFIPQLYPHSFYNARYGMELLPAIALFAFIALAWTERRLRPTHPLAARLMPLVCFALAAVNSVVMMAQTPLVLREGIVNSITRVAFERSVARQLRSFPAGSRILMSTNDHIGAVQQAGTPLHLLLSENDRDSFGAALASPGTKADYVIAIAKDPVDAAVRAHPEGLTELTVLCTTGQPCARIFKSNTAPNPKPIPLSTTP